MRAIAFASPDCCVSPTDTCLQVANGAWIDNAGGHYVVSLPAVAHQQAAARAKPVFTPPSEEAEDEEAFAGWEAKGTAAPRSASARATDRAKAEKADWLANWLHAPDEMTSAEAVAAHDAAVAAAAAAAPAPAEAPQQAAAAPPAMEGRAKERKLAPSVKNVFARNQVEKAVPTDPAVSPPLKVNPKQTLAGTGSGREVLLQGFNWESARSKAVRDLLFALRSLSHIDSSLPLSNHARRRAAGTAWLPPTPRRSRTWA